MEREELLIQIVEKQKEYISYLSKAIDSESILCAITLGVRSNYESELASLTSQLEKTEKPNKPAEVSEDLKTICQKAYNEGKQFVHGFSKYESFDDWFRSLPQVSQKTEREPKTELQKEFGSDFVNSEGYFSTSYVEWLEKLAQSRQVSQVQMTDQQIEDFAKDYCSTSVGSISPLFESGLIVGLRLARDGKILAKDEINE